MTATVTGRIAYRISGLDCPDCASTVDKSVAALDGVVAASLSFATGIMVVEYDSAHDPRDAVIDLVRRMDYSIEPQDSPDSSREGGAGVPRSHALSVAGSGLLIVAGAVLSRFTGTDTVSAALYVTGAIIGGIHIYRRAFASARSRSLDMNVLMTLAVVGAIAIGEYSEAAMVVFLFSVGGLLEARSLARTRRSVRDLMSLTPQIAHLLGSEGARDVLATDCAPGDVVLVRPGERVPADGTIEDGSSAVDESPITGESVPAEKGPGDRVWAGTLNASGVLTVRVESLAGDTVLARIIYLVEQAQSNQAPFQRLVDRFTRRYTPTVVALAVFVAFAVPGLRALAGAEPDFYAWFYRALVLLVVSCPCALVIATPVSIVSAITRATRDGMLVKGGAFLEIAPQLGAMAFDKTGTLTVGRPEVARVIPLDGGDAASVVATAAALEAHSSHPLARAIVRAYGADPPELSRLRDLREEAGLGVSGVLDSVPLLIGRPAFAIGAGAQSPRLAEEIERLESDGETAIVLARAGDPPEPLGVLGVSDVVRDDAASAVASLRAAGVEHIVMLTGDNERVASAIARELGITEYRSALLPEDKTAAVAELRQRYGFVAMVGDGINDAPALAGADIGIAMGAAGSDAALEAADVALMSDDLALLARFVRLGRRTLGIIRQNVWLSVGVKLLVLVAAVAGYAPLWLAVFADTGVALLVILNGLRLLRPVR